MGRRSRARRGEARRGDSGCPNLAGRLRAGVASLGRDLPLRPACALAICPGSGLEGGRFLEETSPGTPKLHPTLPSLTSLSDVSSICQTRLALLTAEVRMLFMYLGKEKQGTKEKL